MAYSVPVSYQYSRDPLLRGAYWDSRNMRERAESFSRDIDRLMKAGFGNLSGQMSALGNDLSLGLGGVERAVGAMGADMNLGFIRLDNAVRQSAQSVCEKLDEINGTLLNSTFTRARELYRLAVTNFGKGFYEEARDDLTESTALHKTDALSWFLLGRIYLFGAGEFGAAVDLDKALAALAAAAKYLTPDAREHADARGMASEVWFHLGLARLYKSYGLSLKEAEGGGEKAARYLDKAEKAFEEAGRYSDKNLEARYLAAWCKAQPVGAIGTAARDEAGALAGLEALITGESAYLVKAAGDSGFAAIAVGLRVLDARLQAALAAELKPALEGYLALLKRSLPGFGGKVPSGLVSADKKLRDVLAANPALDKAPYYELRRIKPLIKHCAGRLAEEIKRRQEEIKRRQKEKREQWEAAVRMFGIQHGRITKYTGPGGAVTIPAGVISIGEKAFSGCEGLTSVTIPAGVTSIGKMAFFRCEGLTSVTIPAGVTSIEDQAFFRCKGLRSVTIPAGVTSIGESAFSWCKGLRSVTIPAGVTSIGKMAFYQCAGLTSVTIPAGVTSIGESAFSGCAGLRSVTIPAGVTSIGESAFSGCAGLTSVTIPAGVTSIGESAFSGCTGLTSVTFEGSNTRVETNSISIINGDQFRELAGSGGGTGAYLAKAGTYTRRHDFDTWTKQGAPEPPAEQEAPKHSAKKGCFITTAVCGSLGKGDDCRELTAFRAFRDNWLAQQPGGPALIAEYYRAAPGIVAAIDRRPDREAVYRRIWDARLAPCLALIEAGDFEACRRSYTEMVREMETNWGAGTDTSRAPVAPGGR
ncbi:MAG: leucine-rich repeat domain-containing protein [Treponema sp.]|jgi:tetratricopeptide (TPR) repeat protein|nr:leucine-rich repeat domain-containing protein [Treponema sp.]